MTIGIIANPASGKDIRRLVAQSSVFDNNEKVNILRRVLRGIDALGGERVVIMPDAGDLGQRALDGVTLCLEATVLDLPVYGDARDSTAAAAWMVDHGVACIVTLGGDGTNRAVAKGSADLPLLPISTGTNNVFSCLVEGTIVGLAAQAIAGGCVDVERVTRRAKRLDLLVDGRRADVALVDVATTRDPFVGSRAMWDPTRLCEVVLSCAQPGSVGLSSVGASLACLPADGPDGLYIRFGEGGRRVLAPIAPGLVVPLCIAEHHVVHPDDDVDLSSGDFTVALDGERELEVGAHQALAVRLSLDGPRVVDFSACLAEASRRGAFER